MNFEVKKSNILFQGKVFDLMVDEIKYKSTGNKSGREVVIHPGGAVIVPVLNDGRIVLIKQYKYPLNKFLLELPAGKLEPNEEPISCAERELTEETGYTAAEIKFLNKIYTTPGYCTEELYIFTAKKLKPGKHNREEGEHGMEVLEMELTEIENLIAKGEITDAKTISGIYFYKLAS
jgi:ADP-ribose pyrophosphatase